MDKDENSLLGTKLNPFPDNINKLPNREVSWDKVPEIMKRVQILVHTNCPSDCIQSNVVRELNSFQIWPPLLANSARYCCHRVCSSYQD